MLLIDGGRPHATPGGEGGVVRQHPSHRARGYGLAAAKCGRRHPRKQQGKGLGGARRRRMGSVQSGPNTMRREKGMARTGAVRAGHSREHALCLTNSACVQCIHYICNKPP